MRLNQRIQLGLGIGLSVLVAALVIGNAISADTAAANPSVTRDAVAGMNAGLAATSRAVEVGDAIWTVTHEESPDGPCMGVVAQVDGVEQGRLGGDCGAPSNRLWWGIGGLDIANQWFYVAFGEVSQLVDSVRVTLGDGTVLTDGGVVAASGLWIIVAPGNPTSPASDFVRITALDAAGSVVAQENPPSIVAYTLQAQAKMGAGGGA